ncbi:MAG: hypothetical protein HY369_02605 [Candidatus Aenigmarchaeota archaeon]|nr:hypothetical protein [Candidatus Aenigmarchaeota archaeon]
MFASILQENATSSNKLATGSPESRVAIVTLWSKVSEMAKKVPPDRYAVMGQLFSAERGLDLLVRNLLANPQIGGLVVTGVDFSKSGIVLLDFFRNGFERGETKITRKPVWRVKSEFEGYIGLDIPADALESLRTSVAAVRVPDIATFDFAGLQLPAATREKRVFEKADEQVQARVGEQAGHVVRGKTVAEAWLKILDAILKFGRESETHYDEPQREILNLLSIIEEEDPANFFIPDYLPCDASRIRAYIPRITRDLPGGIHQNEYTYGSRMRSWFGTDQVKRAVDKLSREPVSRAVVIGLWDPTKDLEIGGSPCLNHVWLRLAGDKLVMTCIFRSHDMFEGYPENAFGLRTLQEEIRQELEQRLRRPITLGELMILSQSAHLYRDTWEWAQHVTRDHLHRRHLERLDPRGNFLIAANHGEIVLEHTGPGGEKIGEFRGRSGEELRDHLVRADAVSLPAHALDLGLEIMKAEVALKAGLPYVQDQPLALHGLQRPPEVPVPAQRTDQIPARPAAPAVALAAPANPRSPVRFTARIPGGRVIKEGLVPTENQRMQYIKILRAARIDSFVHRPG